MELIPDGPSGRPEIHASKLFERMRTAFKLQHEADFDALVEALVEISCAEQRGEPEDPKPNFSDLRSRGRELALAMRDHAASALASLSTIEEALRQFNDDIVMRDSALLEAVFDVDMAADNGGYLPPSINVLSRFYGSADWEGTREALQEFASFPIRQTSARGPMPNAPLRNALKACRRYWRNIEGKAWIMVGLRKQEERNRGDLCDLSNDCEVFLGAILRATGVRYSLQDLASAWKAIDRE